MSWQNRLWTHILNILLKSTERCPCCPDSLLEDGFVFPETRSLQPLQPFWLQKPTGGSTTEGPRRIQTSDVKWPWCFYNWFAPTTDKRQDKKKVMVGAERDNPIWQLMFLSQERTWFKWYMECELNLAPFFQNSMFSNTSNTSSDSVADAIFQNVKKKPTEKSFKDVPKSANPPQIFGRPPLLSLCSSNCQHLHN